MVCDDDSMPLQRKKVCVIGAGMAGLAAARELRREGHDVTVLEQSGDVGGQWLYDPRLDLADPLGTDEPVKVHSSIYASLRLISARENMGFTDFHFAPKDGDGRDQRRFPGHREVYLYLKDFCDAFGLMEFVRLNTRVLRVAMQQQPTSRCRQWAVRSVDLAEVETEEVFDAVVVANGHYSQPRVPSIQGMEAWSGRQMHSHSYRTPEPFRGEVVVVVGSGESGKDIAMEVRKVAKEVHLVAQSMKEVTLGLAKVLAKHGASLRVQLHLERLCEDGRAVFGDGSSVVADTVIYCTGYDYSFPFLDTAGEVTVDDNRVGPLFEHVFPPSLAPSLSFIGIPIKVFAPWFFEAQAKWVAQVLSGRRTLPPEEEMLRSVEEWYRSREIAGVPKKYTHDVSLFDITYMDEFGDRYCDFPRVEGWNIELLVASYINMVENLETFRDDYQDTDSIRKGVEAWQLAAQQIDANQAASVGAQIQSLGLPEQAQ
ncbi:flavin-containing monooxygenase FMO GS-OX-like 9 [Lolium rigidum]|uniref:flavin-containing monooxygenase FMO GS-OX-like 9 n=1 Tax=Lolium rigidum TaxID=89674 RepID=UPI001F5E094A|nr:flavin-containing monooxygenase FMO GS-OX-like 9 [Lolium rigidum]